MACIPGGYTGAGRLRRRAKAVVTYLTVAHVRERLFKAAALSESDVSRLHLLKAAELTHTYTRARAHTHTHTHTAM